MGFLKKMNRKPTVYGVIILFQQQLFLLNFKECFLKTSYRNLKNNVIIITVVKLYQTFINHTSFKLLMKETDIKMCEAQLSTKLINLQNEEYL